MRDWALKFSMNLLGQAVTRELLHSFSSSSSRKCFLLLIRQQQLRQHPLAVLQQHSSLYSTATSSRARTFSKNQKDARYAAENPKPVQQTQMVQKQTQEPQRSIEMEQELKKKEQVPKADFLRPSEIPWQAKVANSVNLIGYVQIPVQFKVSADGKSWAGTIISQSDGDSLDTPPFWIPVIFEGDLAHTAACHLKAKDRVHIAGQLSADPPPFTMGKGQANVQVMVRSISFVEGSSQMKKVVTPKHLQQDINFVVSEIKDDGHPAFHSWKDLVSNPLEWRDHREDKLKGTLKPKHPDFKCKNSGLALWLDSAPKWVCLHLNGLEFAAPLPKVKQEKSYEGGDDSWKNLVENPDTWWDNRTNKVQEKSPDFRHKVTGEALWLSDSPAWVSSRLPPLKAKHTYTKRGKLVSEVM